MTYINRPGMPLKARGNSLTTPLPNTDPNPVVPQQGNALGWSQGHWPFGQGQTPNQPPMNTPMPNAGQQQGNTLGGFWDWLERLRQQYQGQMPQTPNAGDDPNHGTGYVSTRTPYQGR